MGDKKSLCEVEIKNEDCKNVSYPEKKKKKHLLHNRNGYLLISYL